MGPILARLLRKSFKRLENDVLLLGLQGAGKSTILAKLCGEGVARLPDGVVEEGFFGSLKISSWDLNGMTSRRRFYENWPNLAGLIFVIDSSDHIRLELAKREFFEMAQLRRNDEFPVLIFCNKQDVPGAMNVNEIVSLMKIDDTNMCCLAQGLCGITGDGIHEGFNWLENNIV